MAWTSIITTVPAAAEPIARDDARGQLRVGIEVPDAQIDACIQAARGWVEDHCGIFIVEQTIQATSGSFADLARPPFGPIKSVTSISWALSGAATVVDPAMYLATLRGVSPSIVAAGGQRWPSLSTGALVTLTAVVGYPTASIPTGIITAVKMLAAAYFDNRLSLPEEVQTSARRSLTRYKRRRL